MVPTATIAAAARARAASMARGGRRGDLAPFGVQAVARGSSARTGRKVPAPTCSVTPAARDAAPRERRQQRRREVQAGGRRRDRAARAGEDRLVVGAVLRVGAAAADVGRQRHLAGPLQRREQGRARGSKASITAPSSPLASTVAARPSAKASRSPVGSVGRPGEASQRPCRDRGSAGPRRPVLASPPDPATPRSRAGITRVSLKTSRSPRRSSAGRSRTPRSCRPSAATRAGARRRAAGPGAGRSARRQVEIEQVDSHGELGAPFASPRHRWGGSALSADRRGLSQGFVGSCDS